VEAIEAVGLRKVYRRFRRPPQRALDGLDLRVDVGGVHGFLGPNGSGKTTTLRALLGLVRLDGGGIRLLGRDAHHELSSILQHIGSLIEGPQFFPTFSGRRNLRLLAEVADLPRTRVDEALEKVGLGERALDPVKAYSLGMKQRLGVAAALLKRPSLLLLDEPTNGLDPGGIREVRDLIRELGRGEATVLLSSHLLNEVEQVCDAVTIVSHGRVVRSGLVRDVLAAAGGGRVRVRLADLTAGMRVAEAAGWSASIDRGHLLVAGAQPADVNRRLGEAGLWAAELRVETADLEDVFLSLTEEPAVTASAVPMQPGPASQAKGPAQ
jgi:ABC-2 type transport system ATP-binding protein